MSQARITTITKSVKPGVCEKCRTELPPGSAYRHFKVGFRSRYKHVRCMEAACTPRPSELESSKLSEVYAAQEDAEDQLDELDADATADEITEVVTALGEAIQAVADEYEEASTDDNGTVFNTTAEERAETLSSAADELSGFEVGDAETDCSNCDATGHPECTSCGGTGKLHEDECPDCDSGRLTEDCEICNGDGQVFDALAAIDEAREAIGGIEL